MIPVYISALRPDDGQSPARLQHRFRPGQGLLAAAVALGFATPFAFDATDALAAGKTVKTKDLAAVPAQARPALIRAIQSLARGRRSSAAPDIPTPEEMNLICGGEDWLVMWTVDENGDVEDGSVQASCGDNEIETR